jgi:hypothetical protein
MIEYHVLTFYPKKSLLVPFYLGYKVLNLVETAFNNHIDGYQPENDLLFARHKETLILGEILKLIFSTAFFNSPKSIVNKFKMQAQCVLAYLA